MIIDPDVLDLHFEAAMEAFDSVAFQCNCIARHFARGEAEIALRAYDRLKPIFENFISPEVRIIRAAHNEICLAAAAATEYRENRPRPRRQVGPTINARTKPHQVGAVSDPVPA